jgi:hypothetical protein
MNLEKGLKIDKCWNAVLLKIKEQFPGNYNTEEEACTHEEKRDGDSYYR